MLGIFGRIRPNPNEIQTETALDWLSRLDHDSVALRTGHADLDKHSRMLFGKVTEIVGDNATGKLQLAMTIVAELLLSEKSNCYKIAVIDFNGTFRMERLLQILSKRTPSENGSPAKLLDKIVYSRSVTANEFECRLSELNEMFANSELEVPLLIVNKIGAILFDILDQENLNGKVQKRIVRSLHELCSKYGATVILTNHLVDWRGFWTPALGNQWIKGMSRRIYLSRGSDGSRFFRIEVDKEMITKNIGFAVTNDGFTSCA